MDKKLICLDTSILIDYYRKKDKSKTKFVQLSKKYSFAISVITKLEILVGSTKEQETFWVEVFEMMKIIPLSENDVYIAAETIKFLKKKNKIIGLKDTLIASTALSNELELSTLNIKEFSRIEGLRLVHE